MSSSLRKLERGKSRGLKETNVAVLTSPQGVWSEVLQCLTEHAFKVVGMRLVWLTPEQERLVVDTMGIRVQPGALCSGPVLLLAVERDNAVVCARDLLCRYGCNGRVCSLMHHSTADKYSLSDMWGSQLLMPTSTSVVGSV